MRRLFTLTLMMAVAVVFRTAAAENLVYKDQFAALLVKQVPQILEKYDADTGWFSTGVWMSTDQNPMYTLAVAYATDAPGNPYHKDPKLLEVIMKAGDCAHADEKGQWVFTKKDGSTWVISGCHGSTRAGFAVFRLSRMTCRLSGVRNGKLTWVTGIARLFGQSIKTSSPCQPHHAMGGLHRRQDDESAGLVQDSF